MGDTNHVKARIRRHLTDVGECDKRKLIDAVSQSIKRAQDAMANGVNVMTTFECRGKMVQYRSVGGTHPWPSQEMMDRARDTDQLLSINPTDFVSLAALQPILTRACSSPYSSYSGDTTESELPEAHQAARITYAPQFLENVILDTNVSDPTDPAVLRGGAASFGPAFFDSAVMDSTAMDPTVIDPAVIDPAVIDPVLMDVFENDHGVVDATVFKPVLDSGAVTQGSNDLGLYSGLDEYSRMLLDSDIERPDGAEFFHPSPLMAMTSLEWGIGNPEWSFFADTAASEPLGGSGIFQEMDIPPASASQFEFDFSMDQPLINDDRMNHLGDGLRTMSQRREE